MIRISEVLSQIIQECASKNFDSEYKAVIFEDSRLFQELANPAAAYDYEETSPNTWDFQDKYSNKLVVTFDPTTKWFDSYYKLKDSKGNDIKVYDYGSYKGEIYPPSYQGGTDEHRSDTICKILRDEVVPKHLLNKKGSSIQIHALNPYRANIFLKCAEICKEKYPQIEIKKIDNTIYLLNK